MTKRQKFFSALGQFVKNIFTKNILLKVVALLFAILLWGYVLSIENPEYTKRVRDVEIGINGESVLNSRNLMLVTRDLGTTDVDVLCRINKHSELDASRVTCTVDLSNRGITLDTDENSKVITLDVNASVPTEYGTIQNLTVSTVEVEIARISARNDLPVYVKTVGSLPEGFAATIPNASQLQLSISGPKSAMDQIVRGEVTVDYDTFPVNDPDTLAKSYDLKLPVQFYDSSNVRLDEIYASNGEAFTIDVRVTVRAYKEFEIEPSIEMLEEGYTWTYVLSRSRIILCGEKTALDQIDTIRTETITATPTMSNTPMSTNLIIPDDLEVASGFSKSVTVTLSVRELTDTKEIEVPITYQNPATGTTLSADAPKTVTVRVTGARSAMAVFHEEWIKATVDLAGYLEGTVELPVRYSTDSKADAYTIEPLVQTVTVEFIHIEEE